MVKRCCSFLPILLCVLLFSGPRTFGQAIARDSVDPCAAIRIPTLTDKQAEKILKRRRKIKCDKIYTGRIRSFAAKMGVAEARFLELGWEPEFRYLTEIAQVIALKEKILCVYFKGNSEITEEFRRCREREIDKWEKEIIRSITLNREAERQYSGPLGQKSWPDPKKRRERLAEALLQSLHEIHSQGEEIAKRMDAYELKRWKPPGEKENAPSS